MKGNIRSEARQLPLILGKLIGGILAVIGFGGAVYISTRPPKPTAFSIISYGAVGIIGIAVFAICSRIMSSRFGANARYEAGKKGPSGLRILPWVILVVLAVIFIVVMLLI